MNTKLIFRTCIYNYDYGNNENDDDDHYYGGGDDDDGYNDNN